MKKCIFEVRTIEQTIEVILALMWTILSNELCDANAMLYQLNYEATRLGEGQFAGLMCSTDQ